jgi:hypothetical protein
MFIIIIIIIIITFVHLISIINLSLSLFYSMKQTCLANAKEDEKGIAGQARNDRPSHENLLF